MFPAREDDETGEPDSLQFRLSFVERFVAPGIFVIVFWWMGIYQLTYSDLGDRLVGVICLLFGAFGAWLYVFRIGVRVDRERIVVKNPIGTRSIPLVDVKSMQPGYYGVRLETVHGKRYTLVALQKWNVSRALKRRTHTDAAIEAILERRQQALSREEAGL